MTYEEELEMFKECLKQADSMLDISLKYFREYLKSMDLNDNEKVKDILKFEKYLDLLCAAAHNVFKVDLELGSMLMRIKFDDSKEEAIAPEA